VSGQSPKLAQEDRVISFVSETTAPSWSRLGSEPRASASGWRTEPNLLVKALASVR